MSHQLEYIDKAYQAQFDYKYKAAKTSVNERIKMLNSLEKTILKYRNEIASALYSDFRKSKIEAESTEIFPVLSEIRLFKKNLKHWVKSKSVANNIVFFGSKAHLYYEPKGNCLIMSPWNYPFQLSIIHLIPCIAAGNTAILKPSEFSPHTTNVLIKIISEVFQPYHVTVIEGEIEQTSYLLKKKFDHIHFTGSPNVGKIVMEAGSKFLSSVTLELGGKSPLIIDGTMDIDTVVSKAMWGKLINNGQTCIAPDYILIDKNRLNDFVKGFISHINSTFNNDPKSSPDLARMINLKNFNRVKLLIEEAISEGAKCPYGNDYHENELFIKPTLLVDVNPKSRILQEEIFGPVFPIVTFDKIEEAIDFINQRDKPLALYIFSKDKGFVKQIEENTSSGALMVNETLLHIMHPNLPFGGVNHSGIGASTGYFGFLDFSHTKPVLHVNQLLSPTKFLNYPYTNFTQRIVNLMMKYL